MSESVANEKAARGRGPLHRVGGFASAELLT